MEFKEAEDIIKNNVQLIEKMAAAGDKNCENIRIGGINESKMF